MPIQFAKPITPDENFGIPEELLAKVSALFGSITRIQICVEAGKGWREINAITIVGAVDTPEMLAEAIVQAAVSHANHRAKDGRYKADLWVRRESGGALRRPITFSVDLEDGAVSSGESEDKEIAIITAFDNQTKLVQKLTEHVEALTGNLIDMAKQTVALATPMGSTLTTLSSIYEQSLRTQHAAMISLAQMEVEKTEAQSSAEVRREGLQFARSIAPKFFEVWKANLRRGSSSSEPTPHDASSSSPESAPAEPASGPADPGVAPIAAEAPSSSEPPTYRGVVEMFRRSLTGDQLLGIADDLGARRWASLRAIFAADTDENAAAAVSAFYASLTPAHIAQIQGRLTEAQIETLGLLAVGG